MLTIFLTFFSGISIFLIYLKKPGYNQMMDEEKAEEETAAPEQNGAETPADDPSENAPPDADPAAASDELSPEEKIADLENKLRDANDQYLRKAADFENFRKRMNQ
jgi:molecular chaperone GrpE